MKPRLSSPGVLSFVPLLAYGLLMAFACLAYLKVGHWPTYGNPDPKDVLPVMGEVLRLSILLAALGSVPALAVILWSHGSDLLDPDVTAKKFKNGAVALLHLGVFSLGAWLFLTEYSRLSDWLLD